MTISEKNELLALSQSGRLTEAWAKLKQLPEASLFHAWKEELDALSDPQSSASDSLTHGFQATLEAIEVQAVEETPAKQPGISEHKLKQHLMVIMLAMKVVVIGWLYTHFESGGYSKDQFLGLMGVMIPVFTTYTGVMFKEFVDRRHGHEDKGLRVSRPFQLVSYGVLLFYGIICMFILGLKPKGSWEYGQISTWLTLLEAGLGVYVGRLIFTLFGHNQGTS